MDTPPKNSTAPLDDIMLAMDVVDTLRHRQDLVDRALDGDAREAQLIEKLRAIYRHQGIDVPDRILHDGVVALDESRFVYEPPRGGFGLLLARLYIGRGLWGKWFVGIAAAAALGLMAYNYAYIPFVQGQEETARLELAEGLPARMDELYQIVFDETKVQAAVTQAKELRDRGKAAAATADRVRAEQAVTQLENLTNVLRQDYTLKVVNREGVQSGFWTYPEINISTENYYIVVEALDTATDEPLVLYIANEESGETELVSIWGLRVPEQVYRAVAADKRDDGIVQRNIVGLKQYGFLDVDYVVPVLGGAVTRW